jgi:class 3 adenylate cyclase/CheY-like chemotaxis protein/HAMP domain-containing protein
VSRRVLVFHSDPAAARILKEYFIKQGDSVWFTGDPAKIDLILNEKQPTLAMIDLEAPNRKGLVVLAQVRHQSPQTKIIATNKRPDIHLELLGKEYGADVFLREPFNPTWIENALAKAEGRLPESASQKSIQNILPKVRMSMRYKITIPYILLSITFILASLYLVGRYVFESMQERFTNQLIDVGKMASDWMVQEESRILDTVRLLSNMDQMAQRISANDSNALRELILPVAINYQEEFIDVLNPEGINLLSLYRELGSGPEQYTSTSGDPTLAQYEFLQRVLNGSYDERGDKFAGLVSSPRGEIFTIAGPVFNPDGSLAGVILVGKSLETIANQIRQATLAQLSFYDSSGLPLASTLPGEAGANRLDPELSYAILQRQDQESGVRDLQVASVSYSELLGPWEARGGSDLGLIGVALGQNFFVRPSQITGLQAVFFVVAIFLLAIAVGISTARRITQPLGQVVRASTRVAEGDFLVKVTPTGNDEVAVLAHAFNYMIAGLQEGSIYRDLLGRTVSPQVREALRQSFASGELKLEGHSVVATVLMSDVRNFTSLAEKEEPATILKWLNEYFGELVPIINSYGGVVDKFEGDSLLAFFGILPSRLEPEESAYQACQAAIEIIAKVDEINERRKSRNEPALLTGLGINTGTLTAGGLGTSDRLDYTIIGDTVNATQRMEGLTREFGETGAVVGENTLTALRERRGEFRFEPLGEHAFKGKSELLWVYRLRPAYPNGRISPERKVQPRSSGLLETDPHEEPAG